MAVKQQSKERQTAPTSVVSSSIRRLWSGTTSGNVSTCDVTLTDRLDTRRVLELLSQLTKQISNSQQAAARKMQPTKLTSWSIIITLGHMIYSQVVKEENSHPCEQVWFQLRTTVYVISGIINRPQLFKCSRDNTTLQIGTFEPRTLKLILSATHKATEALYIYSHYTNKI